MKQSHKLLLMLTFIFGIIISFSAMSQDLQRGLRNYQEIINGRKKLEQLSSQEQQEVITIHQRLKSQQNGNDSSSECHDARAQAESAASELANYARRLRNCAEAQNYSDDCNSEFRRVKNTYSDYESAVSSVGSNCQ